MSSLRHLFRSRYLRLDYEYSSDHDRALAARRVADDYNCGRRKTQWKKAGNRWSDWDHNGALVILTRGGDGKVRPEEGSEQQAILQIPSAGAPAQGFGNIQGQQQQGWNFGRGGGILASNATPGIQAAQQSQGFNPGGVQQGMPSIQWGGQSQSQQPHASLASHTRSTIHPQGPNAHQQHDFQHQSSAQQTPHWQQSPRGQQHQQSSHSSSQRQPSWHHQQQQQQQQRQQPQPQPSSHHQHTQSPATSTAVPDVQRQQHTSRSTDPFAPSVHELGANGRRAYIPGQENIDPGLFGAGSGDPSANWRYMKALEDLERENRKRGGRG